MADFNGTLWDTMQLVAGTDVFIGMHGAGFTNLLWLRQVSTKGQGQLQYLYNWPSDQQFRP